MAFDSIFSGAPVAANAPADATQLGIDRSSGTLYVNVGAGWIEATASGSGSGISQITGDVTAGPGTGSQAATVVSVKSAVHLVSLAPVASGNFTTAHSLGVTPKAVIIQMTSDGQVWLQSPTGFDGTNIYATASAPSVTATAVCFV